MKIITTNRTSKFIQDWRGRSCPQNYALVPDSLDLSAFYEHNGFVNLVVEGNVVVSMEPNTDAWEAWKATLPDGTIEVRTAKLSAISTACSETITSGFDLEIDGESLHYNLSVEDQSNISNLFNLVVCGGTEFPYQSDGGECRVYNVTEIVQIYIAAQTVITTQTTYHNLLKAYVQTLEDTDIINAIVYGMELPEPYATSLADKLAVAQTQMEAIVANLGG